MDIYTAVLTGTWSQFWHLVRPLEIHLEDMFVRFFKDNVIAPDKAVYCVFTQFRGPENAIKFISVRTKRQYKSLILNPELFRSV